MQSITLTPAALQAIVQEHELLASQATEIHIAPENGTTALVTMDAGYGTYSFHVNRNGRTWQAGLGIGAALVEKG
jgi:hypothetical protein